MHCIAYLKCSLVAAYINQKYGSQESSIQIRRRNRALRFAGHQQIKTSLTWWIVNTNAFTSFASLEYLMKEAATGQPQRMAELGNQWWFAFDTYVVLVEMFFFSSPGKNTPIWRFLFFLEWHNSIFKELCLAGWWFNLSCCFNHPDWLARFCPPIGVKSLNAKENPCCRFVSRQHRQIWYGLRTKNLSLPGFGQLDLEPNLAITTVK